MDTPKPSRVRETKEIARRISRLTLDNVLGSLPEPGQFVMIWDGSDEKPMAVTTINGDELTITVKDVGPFTERLNRSKPGDVLGIRGPYGRSFDLSYEKPLLVAGGIGASPVRYLANSMVMAGKKPKILVGFNTAKDAVYVEELERLSDTTVCCVDGGVGLPGTATDNLPPLGNFDCVFTCGPEPMMVAVGMEAEESGTECQLLVERYFKCGIGLCGSCALGRLIPCRDGPVFFWRELKGTEFGSFKRNACGLRESLP